VAGGVVSTRDEDILDFDFFDEEESPTWEEPEDLEPPPGGRGPRDRGPRFRAPGNLTPLLRLVALIALAILVVVLLVVWIEGCATDAKQERYGDYMTEIGAVGSASAALGRKLTTLLTTPGLSKEDLDARLAGYAQTARNQAQRAEDLRPPGPLVAANAGAVEALRYRANGIQALRVAFQELPDDTDPAEAGQRLADAVRRLTASDVIWPDSFMVPSEAVLKSEGIEGVAVPSSEFVTTDDITTSSALAAIWQRVQGASIGETPSGLHGSGISYVKVLPSGQLLSTETQTTILVTTELAFEVGVENTGDFQEVQIKVTLTIPKTPDPIVVSGVIPIIDPGEVKSVTLKVGTLVPFEEQTTVKVDVDPVPGETNTANNTAEYPVVFTLA
jgi:hypothetical protein